MATATNKQKLITQILGTQHKQSRAGETTSRPVLEQFIYAICRSDTTRTAADQIFENLTQRFYDWNEVRVSSAHEVAEAMDGVVSDAEPRAQRVIDFLQEVFETTFSFDLDGLQKKGVKIAAKTLGRYQAADDFAVSFVVQQTLGGHAIPLDGAALRLLRRTGMLEEAGALEADRASVEHQVPKAKGVVFLDLVSDLADAYCYEADPNCPECPLRTSCVTGLERRAAVGTAKKSR